MAQNEKLSAERLDDLKQSLAHPDLSMRLNAALDLAKVGDKDAIPTLIEGFRADSIVTRLFHAGKALISFGEAAVPALEGALSAVEGTVRVDAAYTLWQIDPSRADELLPVAMAELQNWDPNLTMDEQMRMPVADVVDWLGEMESAAQDAIPLLIEMIRTPVRCDDPLAWREDVRTTLALLMTRVADSAHEAVDALIEALSSQDDSLRWGAARALGEFGEEASKAIPGLVSLLTNEAEVESIRVEAAYSLAVMAHPQEETLPALLQALDSKDWWVRSFTVRILGEMGSPESDADEIEGLAWLDRAFILPRSARRIKHPEADIVPLLCKALTDKDYNVRRNAVFAIGLIGEPASTAIPALIQAMQSADIGPVAAEAIAKIGAAALPLLQNALRDRRSPFSEYAAYALSLLDLPAAQEGLNELKKEGIVPLTPGANHFYVQCLVNFDADKKAAFEALYQETIAGGMGGEVTYTLPYPKHEFLRYLVEEKGLLMHGTERPDLTILRPLRDSTDTNDHGNVSGIYADKGYMRPIYFAVIHRKRCFGLNNGFFDLREDGTTADVEDQGLDRRYYKLTVGITGLRRDPWRNGTVYALPPETFEYWNEWTSRTPVKPVLRLAVTPDDLPLKEELWGTDYRMFARGTWVDPEKDTFPFLKDVGATPFHPAGRPPWLRR